MSIFSWLTSAPKVVDNVFDKDNGLLTQVGSWIGNQQLTDQERLEVNASMVKGVQAFAVATLSENTDRSKARRTIAVEWIKMQIWLIKLSVFASVVDMLIISISGGESNVADSIIKITFSPYLWGITGAVSVFFFGSHALRSTKWGKD